MRTLLTGARGFCARHLAARLHACGHTVAGIDLGSEGPRWVDEYAEADMTRSSDVTGAVRRFHPDAIFHLAGLSRGAEADIFRVNVDGTLHLLDAVVSEVPDARVLLVGSAAEYGPVHDSELPVVETHDCRPVSPYGASKHQAVLAGLEMASRGFKVVVARPFNIIGSGMSDELVVGALVSRIRAAAGSAGTVRIGNLDAARDFVAVEDVAGAYIRMIDGGFWGEVFNICSGVAHTIREIAERLCGMAAFPVTLQVDPALVRPGDVPVMVGSAAKAETAFGFQPRVTLDESLLAAWTGGGECAS